MSAEKVFYPQIRHKVEGKILKVRVGKKRRKFHLEGSPLQVDLNEPPLGSGPISMPEKVYCRVYTGRDEAGEYCQGITEPVQVKRKRVRFVSQVVRVPHDSTGFNPYTETLNEVREKWGQRSDS